MTFLNTFSVGFFAGAGALLGVQWSYGYLKAVVNNLLSFEDLAEQIYFGERRQ